MKKNGSAKPKRTRPTVQVKPRSYQPTKAELEEKLYVPATPEQVAKAVTSLFNVQETDDPQ